MLPSGDAQDTFDMLNPSLRHEVKITLYLDMLKKCHTLTKGFARSSPGMSKYDESLEAALTAVADGLQVCSQPARVARAAS